MHLTHKAKKIEICVRDKNAPQRPYRIYYLYFVRDGVRESCCYERMFII